MEPLSLSTTTHIALYVSRYKERKGQCRQSSPSYLRDWIPSSFFKSIIFIVDNAMHDVILEDIDVTDESNATMQVHMESKRLVWHKKCV